MTAGIASLAAGKQTPEMKLQAERQKMQAMLAAVADVDDEDHPSPAVAMLTARKFREKKGALKLKQATKAQEEELCAEKDRMEEQMADTMSGKCEDDGDAPERYTVLKKATLRQSFALDAPKAGFLDIGEVIEVVEHASVMGKARVRCARGWASVESSDGSMMLQKIDEHTSDVKLAAVLEPSASATMDLWSVFDCEETYDFEVDVCLSCAYQRDVSVRATTLVETEYGDVVRVSLRKGPDGKASTASARKRTTTAGGKGLVNDIGLLTNSEKPMCVTLRQLDSQGGFTKEIHSLMELEHNEEYITETGNTIERKELQKALLAGRVELPIPSPIDVAWMVEGLLPKTLGSTAHIMCCMTQQGKPCMVFFLRESNMHPGTVERLRQGSFKCCTRVKSHNMYVTTTKSTTEKFGTDLAKGTKLRALKRSTVRDTPDVRLRPQARAVRCIARVSCRTLHAPISSEIAKTLRHGFSSSRRSRTGVLKRSASLMRVMY